jgi:hypothetical protein
VQRQHCRLRHWRSAEQVRHIGVLSGIPEANPETKARLEAIE